MTYARTIAAELRLREQDVAAAVELFDEGNTLPFVARYRKERTGGLDEEQLRSIMERLAALRALDDRRAAILASLEQQGVASDELRRQIAAATTKSELEDLYQPYKPKRRTRASMARERGLLPLAELILAQRAGGQGPDQLAAPFLSADVPDVDAALAGARDIVAEIISDDPSVRGPLRERAARWSRARASRVADAPDERGTYAAYYEFEALADRLQPHQILALNRGEREGVLKVAIEVPARDWRDTILSRYRPHQRSPLAEQLNLAIEDGAERLLLPAIERDVRRLLTERAEAQALEVFRANLRSLLLQQPLAERTVLGIDPGFRTGCKLAVVDPTGRVLATSTIFPHETNRRAAALQTLAQLARQHGVTLIAIGNGTASRETEQLVAELTRATPELHYLIVSEAGASVYSASPLARAELPDLDVSMRGAVSIARRALDPLAELVKIDPRSIGIGMYQHDVDQTALSEALGGVVESVVNYVGVEVNTASPALLSYVAGIGPKLAERIVAHRDEHGPFASRAALKKVRGLGPKSFEQAAGFLRVRESANPLDASAIHPESYAAAEALLRRSGLAPKAAPAEREAAIQRLLSSTTVEDLATLLKVGVPTLRDMLEQLVRPGRDPRADVPPPLLRSDVLSLDQLQTGMVLRGTVRNVVDFGAFVDLGVKQDGLLHRSQIPRGTLLSAGDVIEVEVLRVEADRGRIALGWPS